MTRRAAAPAAPVAAPGVVRPPMPLDDLDRWLRAPRALRPVADSLAVLDGHVTAIVAGPVTYEPLGWLCPLLGVTKGAYRDGDTPEFAAIAAVAEHHNAIAATLSQTPDQFTPRFGRSETGTVDVGPWCRGFYAAIQLNPKYWRKLLPARPQDHFWLIPILAHCTRAAAARDRSPNSHALVPIATSCPPS
jgi:yecA family protein